MLIYKTLALLLLLPLVAFAKPITISELEITKQPTVKELMTMYALKYGATETELLKVAKCESNLNTKAIHYNDGGKGKHSFGIFQYQESTFNNFDNLIGENLDYYSYNDQIRLTAFIFGKYPNLKSHWSCYKLSK